MKALLPGETEQAAAMSDAELVQATCRGDKRAFVALVARHQAMVCGIALGIVGDFAASEDVGQEAFLTAWRRLEELREPERLRAWLGQIARNAALGYVRRKRDYAALEAGLKVADDAPGPDEAAASGEEAALVRETLAQLPEAYRLPLILYYREGQSTHAVAEALGLSEEAVRQRLARGREMLRERMTGLIETVLTRTGPRALFTMAIAAAIGALTAPAAVASSIAGVGTASAAVTSTAGSATSPILTAMSISKSVLVTAALAALVCVPVGYQLRTKAVSAAGLQETPKVPAGGAGAAAKAVTHFEQSALFAEWRALHERYGTNAAAMPALYKAIGALQDPFKRRAFQTALVAEWAQVDPAGGRAFFLSKGADGKLRRQFFEEWLTRDAGGAVAALLAGGEGWESVGRDCLTEIARRLPGRVPEVVSRLPKAESYWDTSVREAFTLLAEGDLAGTRRAAESVSGPNRDQALAGVAQAWAKRDLAGAMAWAKGLPEGADRDEILRAALLGKAAVDPVGALEQVGTVPSGGRHAYFASTTGARVLAAAAQTDFDATVAWVAAHPGRLGPEDLYGLSEVVTDRLDADVAGFLSAHATDGSLPGLLPAVGSALLNRASGQRAAVWDWLQGQPESETVRSLRESVLSSAGYQEPDLALRLAADLPRTAEGEAQVELVARSVFNGGRALDRFDKLFPTAPERLQPPLLEAAFGLLRSSALEDPQPWISRLAQLPEAARPQGAEALAGAWAAQAPEEALGWANSLAPGESRTGAMAGLAAAWAGKDAQSAAEWVGSLPAGAERDRSAQALVLAIAKEYPREAWEWALSINDPAARSRAAAQAATMMAARDPSTARQWIQTGPFTPEMRAKLEGTVKR